MRFATVGISAFLLLLATTAQAQPISKYTASVYNLGAATTLSAPVDIQAVNVTCNQPPTAGGVNPTKLSWDDPANTGKVCVWTDPGTGPLFSVPFGGSYEATLTATNSAGTSPESNRAPFQRPGLPPPAVTGLKAGR